MSSTRQTNRPWRMYRLRVQWDSKRTLQSLGKLGLPVLALVITFFLIYLTFDMFSWGMGRSDWFHFALAFLSFWACAGVAYLVCLMIYRSLQCLDRRRARRQIPYRFDRLQRIARHPQGPERLPHRYLEYFLCGRPNITSALVKHLPKIPGNNLFMLFDVRTGLEPALLPTDVNFEPICFGKDHDRLAWLYAHQLNAQGWRASDVTGLVGDYLDALQSDGSESPYVKPPHDQPSTSDDGRSLSIWLQLAVVAIPVLSAVSRRDVGQLIIIGFIWALVFGLIFWNRRRTGQTGRLSGPDLWLYPGGLALTKSSHFGKRWSIEHITLTRNNVAIIVPSDRIVASVNGKGRLLLNDDAFVALTALINKAKPPTPEQLHLLLHP